MSPIRRASDRRGGRALVGVAALLAVTLCTGCSPLSTLWGAGAGADKIASLSWFLIAVAAVVYVIVMTVMFVAMARNRDRAVEEVDLTPRSTRFVSIGGAVLPGIILLGVFVVAMAMMGAQPVAVPPRQLVIHVTAHQWWWQAEYDYPDLQQRFTTANELHIPVGIPVKVLLTSADVIHSFWVPRLQGKLDVIPGDTNDIRLLADRPGAFRGTCAEFCGMQHAHMGMVVVADTPAQFARWATAQLAPGESPHDSIVAEGQRLFVSGPCAMCHTVRGTAALGSVGPDLTHVASRTTIGAGLFPNSLGSLEGWIANAPALKPGTLMPPNTQFGGEQLRALAEYVHSLR